MKKVISFVLVLSILLGLFAGLSFNSAALSSSGSCGTNVTYTFDSSTGLLTISGSGTMTDYYYYYYYEGSPFYNQTSIKTVVINSGVTSIGYYAFYNCSGLTSITIPNSVSSIGYGAFWGCRGLKELTMPASAKIYNSTDTFYNCINIEKVTLTKGTGTMQNYASSTGYSDTYYQYTPWHISRNNLKELVIEDGVKNIGTHAFRYCTGLTSITIPDSVTSIGSSAFRDCSGLTSVKIGNSVTSISDYAFYCCTGLTSVTIGDSVKSIGDYVFYCCTGLTSVTIGDSVKSIGDYAFSGCSSLTSITIPDSVTSIGSGAFGGCSGLTSITIPNSVTSIGYYAFYNCSGLTSITVDANNPVYDSRNNCNAIIKSDTNTLISGCKNTVIPNSVTSIGAYAFRGCSSLTSITIPNSVTSISHAAFYGCSGLTSVTIPDSVTSIGGYAFYVCSGLTSITIPNSVTSIGEYAFYYCIGLTSITIPNSVTSIGEYAFYGTSNNLKVTASCEKLFVNNIIKGTNRTWNKQHGADSAVEVVPSTCTAQGYTTHTCSVCGDNYKDTYTDALGHNNKSVITKAKINANGKIVTTCKRCGVSSTKTIYYPKTISLSKNAFVYNKKVQKPTVTVKDSTGKALKNGTDYSVAYTNNKVVGTAKAVITFAGKYSGTKTLTFTILPKGTSLAKLTPAKKAFTAQWSKQAVQTTGYQLQYATNAKFTGAKAVTIKNVKTLKYAVKKLSAKKTYYVRVRTYKTINKVNYYSAWSGTKKVKTK